MPFPAIRKSSMLMLAFVLLSGFLFLQAQQANPAPTVPASSTSGAPSAQTPTAKPASSPEPPPATNRSGTAAPVTKPATATPATIPAAKPAPVTKHATATPIDIKKSELSEPIWDPKWDEIVENALPPSLLSNKVPRDVRRFCPRFYRMSDADKRAFWAYFFQALAGAEAGLNPTSHVRHVGALIARDPVTHEPVHCEGLLQLTYQDSKRYGCNFDWDADRRLKPGDPARTILQPKNNLECGVKILTRQIIDNNEPIFYRLSYWATLRPGTPSYRIFARQMVSPPHACGYPSRARRILDHVLAMRRLMAGR